MENVIDIFSGKPCEVSNKEELHVEYVGYLLESRERQSAIIVLLQLKSLIADEILTMCREQRISKKEVTPYIDLIMGAMESIIEVVKID